MGDMPTAPWLPTVSVVLPTHNRPVLFAEAVASVLAQTYRPIELVIADDASDPPVGSPSGTDSQVAVRLIRHDTAQGGAAAKAVGTAATTGELVCFLDDDDLLAPDYVARAVEVLARNADVDVLFMGVDWFGTAADYGARTHGESMARVLAEAPPQKRDGGLLVFDDALLPALLRRVPMPFQRPVVRRAALARIGNYRAECLLWDCDWALRACLHARCGLLNEPLYRQRVAGQGYSSKGSREREHLESACEMTRSLFEEAGTQASSTIRAQLRDGAALNAGRLAYFHAQRGRLGPALRAWFEVLRLHPRRANWKLPLSAAARAMGLLAKNGD